mgnify:FL=1
MPLWRDGRAWWGPLHWGWFAFKRTQLVSFSVRRWSVAIYLRWFGLHFGLRDDGDYDAPRWEVSWHDGCFWLEHPWVRQDGWCRSDPWWRKQIVLRVADWLLGRTRFEGVKDAEVECLVPMPEGCYMAKAKRETCAWRRRWYWPALRQVRWTIDIPGGIPFAGKGENSWDCGDDGLWGLSGPGMDTLPNAIGAVVASVLRSRDRRGLDSKRTGAAAAVVLNADAFKRDGGAS